MRHLGGIGIGSGDAPPWPRTRLWPFVICLLPPMFLALWLAMRGDWHLAALTLLAWGAGLMLLHVMEIVVTGPAREGGVAMAMRMGAGLAAPLVLLWLSPVPALLIQTVLLLMLAASRPPRAAMPGDRGLRLADGMVAATAALLAAFRLVTA